MKKNTFNIGFIKRFFRLDRRKPTPIPPTSSRTMEGAGVRYRGKSYITHSTLLPQSSALETIHSHQKIVLSALALTLILAIFIHPLLAFQIIIATLSVIYFSDVTFNLFLVLKSIKAKQEISSSPHAIESLKDKDLPYYSILCPLYKEAHILPQFLQAIEQLEWPKQKLDVLILLEEDDRETQETIASMDLPVFVRTIVVPDSLPKTKPKACNYGLSYAKGKYLVIYDAEDIPDPLQLKKAYLGFQQAPDDIACLQAKLSYYNPNQNLLTRFFTAEYALWFDVILPGLQAIQATIPLGGTSNHFRRIDLVELHGWDPFNVTEDADLGVRLFKKGYKTAIIDSTTYEEANSAVGNWLRQRSRWIKGYMQTYFVHMRDFGSFAKNHGIHALLFQLVVGGKVVFLFINPLLWILTFLYFAFYAQFGETIASFYPSLVFYIAVVSLVFGNFLFMYYYMVGCAKRAQWGLIKYVFLAPIYWLMISTAGFIALYQFIVKPHYWEKTVHGLHLSPQESVQTGIRPAFRLPVVPLPGISLPSLPSYVQRILQPQPVSIFSTKSNIIAKVSFLSSTFLSIGSIIFVLVMAVYNLPLEYAVTNSFLIGIVYLLVSQGNFLSLIMQRRITFLEHTYGTSLAVAFWHRVSRNSLTSGIVLASIWVAFSPLLAQFLETPSLFPILFITPVLLLFLFTSVQKGYLMGKLFFGLISAVVLIETLFYISGSFVLNGTYPQAFSIIYSLPIFFSLAFYFAKVQATIPFTRAQRKKQIAAKFPLAYVIYMAIHALTLTFFSVADVLLARWFLDPSEALLYISLSIFAKLLFISNEAVVSLLYPFEKDTQKRNSHRLVMALSVSVLISSGSYLFFSTIGGGLFSILSLSYDEQMRTYLLPLVVTSGSVALARLVIMHNYFQKIYSMVVVPCMVSLIGAGIMMFQDSAQGFVLTLQLMAGLTLVTASVLSLNKKYVKKGEEWIRSQIFVRSDSVTDQSESKRRILIYNWRDMKHMWAGGAEMYITELAKRWTKNGASVTLFCSSDGKSQTKETIDNIRFIRKGGRFTVYMWGFLYYLFSFRGKYDVIIDCENGIPFFTPLYANTSIVLLVHHIHLNVFKKHLQFPLSQIASFLEGHLMPIVYRNTTIVTVSHSTYTDVLDLGLGKNAPVYIVHSGVDKKIYRPSQKAQVPTFMYVGRLKPYKQIDLAIRAFEQISKEYPKAQFIIAGDGESKAELQQLANKLQLGRNVQFLGRISDTEKAKLLAQSWAMVQPSLVEGWGLSVLEANACGTPVLAFNVNGLKDSVVHNSTGLLVSPNNISELAESMRTIINFPEKREALAKEAYAFATGYNWQKSAAQFFEVIESEAGEKSAPLFEPIVTTKGWNAYE